MFTAKSSFNTSLIILASSEVFMNNSHFGKKQYVNIVKLRAIESGRYVVKCSDQGISCVINQKGDIVKVLTEQIENVNVKLLTKNTVYQTLLTKT
jgi:apolipoprotein N-acyltransferase